MLIGVLFCLLLSPVQAQQLSAGLHWGESDDLDDQHWQQLSVAGKWQHNALRFKLSSGWLQLDDKTQGLTDTWLGATWLINKPYGNHWWDLQFRLKAPTGDASKALGTGSWDQEIRIQALKSLKPWLAWYYLGYRHRGESDEFQLQDSALWGLGAQYKVLALAYDGREASQPDKKTQHSLSLILQFKQGKQSYSPYIRLQQDGHWGLGISLNIK